MSGARAVWIVLPAFNEAADLPELLEAIGFAGRGLGWYTVVVDDGSTDGTGSVAGAFAGQIPLTLLVHPENRGLAAAIRSMDPDLPMAELRTMRQVVEASMAGDRFNTLLFGSFAMVALLLAAVGIYGVMSFVVAQRTHEIGLRMALGADRARVLRDVLRDGMATALLGTLLGTGGAYFVGRLMRGMVYGVGVMDPTAFVAVALLLLGAALLACLVPARRAASVDPMVALRR